MDFDDCPITEEEVIAVLGSSYKVQGHELVYRCPACPGGDKKGDNLKFNRTKNVLHCFACDFAEEVTGIIARRRFEVRKGNQPQQQSYEFQRQEPVEEVQKPVKEKEIARENLAEYYIKCNERLLSDKTLLKKLYEKHSIMPMTACECFIGFDGTKDKLVFPSRAAGKDPLDNMLIEDNGAEYREIGGEKTIRRISGYDIGICVARYVFRADNGIICEGYKDAYNLVQILKLTDRELLDRTTIFTLQNGTGSINTENCLQKINWRKFKTVGVLMDNDKAGDVATETAQELFSCMADLREEYINGFNDVQERFLEEFGHLVDIDKALEMKWLTDYSEGA